jgi:hypothetical protein
VFGFMPYWVPSLLLYAGRKNPQCALPRRVSGCWSLSGHFVEEKNFLTLLETEPRIVQPVG